MSFLLELAELSLSEIDPSEVKTRFERYRKYLDEVRGRLPAQAQAFAEADWHYDHRNHRCPHDSWVDVVTIEEIASGDRSEVRSLEIKVRLLAAYHDGHILLRYDGVERYSMTRVPKRGRPTVGHGDWLMDEIRLSDEGLVAHEVIFSEGGRWLIECADVTCEWRPIQRDLAGSRPS
jgi:hypothetical protein